MKVMKLIKPINYTGFINANIQDLDNRITSNTNNIETNRTNIAANTTAIANKKGLDKLMVGDNLTLTQQTDNFIINTKDTLLVNTLSSRNGQLVLNNQTTVKANISIEGLVRVINNAKTSSFGLVENDLKLENTNGNVIAVDSVGAINLRTLKTNQDQLISGLSDALIFKNKGEWDSATNYVRYDVVKYQSKSYWLNKDSSTGQAPSPENTFWVPLSPTASADTYTRAEIDNKFSTTNDNVSSNTQEITALKQQVQDNHNNIIANEGRIEGVETDTQQLNTRLQAIENQQSNVAKINQENTFTANQNINAELKVGNPTSNRLQMWNFDYANNNYSALKFIKGESTNLLQIQVNNNTNEANIISSNLKISGVQNPVNATDAVNKQYIDNSIFTVNNSILANTTNINQLTEKTTNLENEQNNLQEDVSANTNAITKLTTKTYEYGENLIQGETWNGKQVYMYRFNLLQDIDLPSSGGALVFNNVDEIIYEDVRVANPFGDSATTSGWIPIPCVDRKSLTKQLTSMITTSNEYRLLNYGFTGNRRFRGYVKYTKVG